MCYKRKRKRWKYVTNKIINLVERKKFSNQMALAMVSHRTTDRMHGAQPLLVLIMLWQQFNNGRTLLIIWICVSYIQTYNQQPHGVAFICVCVYILVLTHIDQPKKTSRHNNNFYKKWMAAAGRMLERRWHRMINLIATTSLFINCYFVAVYVHSTEQEWRIVDICIALHCTVRSWVVCCEC